MKKNVSSFLIPFAAIIFSMIAFSVQGQDDGITSYDLQNSSAEIPDQESKTVKNSVTVRDTVQISDFYQKPKVAERKSSGTLSNTDNEEDALSLNFLFYIIENYKFSDLMDTR